MEDIDKQQLIDEVNKATDRLIKDILDEYNIELTATNELNRLYHGSGFYVTSAKYHPETNIIDVILAKPVETIDISFIINADGTIETPEK